MFGAPRDYADILCQAGDHVIPIVYDAGLDILSDVVSNIFATRNRHIQTLFFELSRQL